MPDEAVAVNEIFSDWGKGAAKGVAKGARSFCFERNEGWSALLFSVRSEERSALLKFEERLML